MNEIPFDPRLSEYTEPPEEDFSYLPPKEKDNSKDEETDVLDNLENLDPASLADPETRSELETLMIKALTKILKSDKSSAHAMLGAVKEIKDILGFSRGLPTPVAGENVQVNNIGLNPDQAKHLLEGLKNARAIAEGTDSGIKPLSGGKGV